MKYRNFVSAVFTGPLCHTWGVQGPPERPKPNDNDSIHFYSERCYFPTSQQSLKQQETYVCIINVL